MKFFKIMMCALALTGLYSSVQAAKGKEMSFKVVNETGDELNWRTKFPPMAGTIKPSNFTYITVSTSDFEGKPIGMPIFKPISFSGRVGKGEFNPHWLFKVRTLTVKPGKGGKLFIIQE